MDKVIQDSQPVFMVVWLGSILSVVVTASLSIWKLDGLELGFVIAATLLWLLGVQLPTFKINIPLNNKVQKWDLASMSQPDLGQARATFEKPWTTSNSARTFVGIVATMLLMA